jgi:hypothetical protein
MAELDLFIAATDLDGRVSRIPDKAGSIIDVKDHRTVFHLQHRKDQLRELNAPFKPSEVTRKSLAKLAIRWPQAIDALTVDCKNMLVFINGGLFRPNRESAKR